MNLTRRLAARARKGAPVRTALIGAGKLGSMFLAQVPFIPGLDLAVIADRNPGRAISACRAVGWDEERIARTRFTTSGTQACDADGIEVVIEATGHPAAGIAHALAAIEAGRHIIMANVEADALAGPLLARKASDAGTVYSLAYGDQPALVAGMVDWARAAGFAVAAAGKGTKYLPAYHAVTPDDVWNHYGVTAAEAARAGMNPLMFSSLLDGTKSAIEMAAAANACDLGVPEDGLGFLPCGADDLVHVLRPRAIGGQLEAEGMVEAVSSLERDGRPVFRDLRWGVYVVLRARNAHAAACFGPYGLPMDTTGRYAAMYRPFHLAGLELSVSVLTAALCHEPTGCPREWRGDAVAVAKRALSAEETLDGEGGYTVYGKLIPAARSIAENALPIGLAHGVKLLRNVPAGTVISKTDVALDETALAARVRREMELQVFERG
jgi:predicted homoserine dehydrogenase-like protein